MKKKILLIALSIIMAFTMMPFMSSSTYAKEYKGTYYDSYGAIISNSGKLLKKPGSRNLFDTETYEKRKIYNT